MELDLDKLTAIRVLGRGATGTVFLVADRSTARFFALKVVEKLSTAGMRARWEADVLSRLHHPFLPTLLGRHESTGFLAWAVPFCAGGDLSTLQHSQSDGVFSCSAIRFYVSELVLALSHLHSLGIVYRDLKPENVLIQSSGHVTLTDFDLSRQLSPSSDTPASPEKDRRKKRRALRRISSAIGFRKFDEKKAKSVRVTPSLSAERSGSFVGTEEYVSPEVIRGDGHEFSVDWWALGILTYEMAYGRTPFKGRNRKETFFNVISREPGFVGKRPVELTELIRHLLAKEPTRRLGFQGGAEEVKAQPFFRGVQWDLLSAVARPPFLVADDSENRTAAQENGGFDVRDYFVKSRPTVSPESPPRASISSTEF